MRIPSGCWQIPWHWTMFLLKGVPGDQGRRSCRFIEATKNRTSLLPGTLVVTMTTLDQDFFLRDARMVARDLLGCLLRRVDDDGEVLSGRIVETEAYRPDDPASHAFRGPSPRNASMFLPGGHAYVYRIYGVHRCFNVVTGPAGEGAAVLVRGLEPVEGLARQWRRRWGEPMPEHPPAARRRGLGSGPAKICRSLGLSVSAHDGIDLRSDSLTLIRDRIYPDEAVGRSRRIGLSAGKGDLDQWRWFVRESSYLSRRGAV